MSYKDEQQAIIPIPDTQLTLIISRVNAATAGPWVSYVEGREEMSGSDFIMTGGEDIYLTGASKADQDFIAAARQDIVQLVNEVIRLRSLIS